MNDMTTLSFEAALAELAELTKKLEQGQIPLADALTLHSRAQALLAHTEQCLAPLVSLGS